MKRTATLLALLALAIANAFLSQNLMMVFALQGLWYPPLLPAPLWLMFGLSVAVLALLYLMLSGAVAAVFEHVLPRFRSTLVSDLVWLSAMLALSVPTLLHRMAG